jgi:Cd2+/Zn2+-exporting ATPase
LLNALIAGSIAGAACVLNFSGLIPGPIAIILYCSAIIIGGYHWIRESLELLIRRREIGIGILMIAATIGSIILDMWSEAALLAVLYAAAEGVEELTCASTRSSIRKLLEIAPKDAVLLDGNREVLVPAAHILPDNIFLVRPGAGIPTDGVIIEGTSGMNEASVTGESAPVEKAEGMNVFAGTINGEGELKVRATAAYHENTLSKIIHLVEETQDQKGRTQAFIERFGRMYTPVILGSSLILAIFLPMTGMSFPESAARSVVLLVAAAPCALVMSTPVVIAAGIGEAGKKGILIKGGAHLEMLGKIRAVAFDKTGTLTTGSPAVTDVQGLEGEGSEVLSIAYGVEQCSDHPIAKAIRRYAETSGIAAPEAKGRCALAGQGGAAWIGGVWCIVGKPESFERIRGSEEIMGRIGMLRGEGKTVVAVETHDRMLGIIAVRDEIRPEAHTLMGQIHTMGIVTIMLTGDNGMTAERVASSLGIGEVHADMKPEDKIAAIGDLKRRYGTVAMVGDGINDAPALASASVGIAMGAIGTDAAIEAADVALMADNLVMVKEAIHYGRRAASIERLNIAFSLLVLGMMIPAALLGILGIGMAVILHEASELLAVGNSLRIAR